jgi:DNA polymerase-3 subunit gamma/tau
MEVHEAITPFAPATEPPTLNPPLNLGNVWQQTLERVGTVSPFIKSHLVDARPISLEGQVFVIGYDPEFAGHKDLAAVPRTIDLVQTKLKEILHNDVVIKFEIVTDPSLVEPTPSVTPCVEVAPEPEIEAAAEPEPATPAPTKPKRDFRDDPLIKKALEIFRGQIVDVKA